MLPQLLICSVTGKTLHKKGAVQQDFPQQVFFSTLLAHKKALK